MNWFDLVLVIAVLVGVIVGYMQGLLRQLIGLGALYIGLVMAAYFQGWAERWIGFFFPRMAETIKGSLAFLALFALSYGLLDWLGRHSFPETRLAVLGPFDQLGGVVIGFLIVGVEIGVGVTILEFLAGVSWIRGETLRLAVVEAMGTSHLVPFFQNYLSLVGQAILPWLPSGLPPLFYHLG